jgi:hypothetical protein
MTPRDPFELWLTERKKSRVPEDFSDRVMNAVRAEVALRRAIRAPERRSTSFAVLTLSALVAAGSGVAILTWHLTLVGALVLAIAGTAN